jgi:hypothetical protein
MNYSLVCDVLVVLVVILVFACSSDPDEMEI